MLWSTLSTDYGSKGKSTECSQCAACLDAIYEIVAFMGARRGRPLGLKHSSSRQITSMPRMMR